MEVRVVIRGTDWQWDKLRVIDRLKLKYFEDTELIFPDFETAQKHFPYLDEKSSTKVFSGPQKDKDCVKYYSWSSTEGQRILREEFGFRSEYY